MDTIVLLFKNFNWKFGKFWLLKIPLITKSLFHLKNFIVSHEDTLISTPHHFNILFTSNSITGTDTLNRISPNQEKSNKVQNLYLSNFYEVEKTLSEWFSNRFWYKLLSREENRFFFYTTRFWAQLVVFCH